MAAGGSFDSRAFDLKVEAAAKRAVTAACVVVLNRARKLLNVDGARTEEQIAEHVAGLGRRARRDFAGQFNRNRATQRVAGRGYARVKMRADGSLVKLLPTKSRRRPKGSP